MIKVLRRDAIPRYLTARNEMLGGMRPLDLLISGQAGRVSANIERSSENVFQDLGFPSEEAEYLKIGSTLMIQLRKTIDAKGMKQAEAAKLLGVTQPRVSDLYKGKIHLFSIDTLVDMLAHTGVRVKLVVGPSKRKLKVA
jgi:predicted XRE-type DNA-binding protein